MLSLLYVLMDDNEVKHFEGVKSTILQASIWDELLDGGGERFLPSSPFLVPLIIGHNRREGRVEGFLENRAVVFAHKPELITSVNRNDPPPLFRLKAGSVISRKGMPFMGLCRAELASRLSPGRPVRHTCFCLKTWEVINT